MPLYPYTHHHNIHILNLHPGLNQTFLEGIQRSVDVISLCVRDTDAHMSKPYILGRDLLVQTSRKDYPFLQHVGQYVSCCDSFW